MQTNPLKEAERPKRLAKYEPRTTDWCPSLIKSKTTRVLTGEEAEKFKIGANEGKSVQQMADIARSDLADSDDEDLSSFGKEVKRKLASSHDSGIERSSLNPQAQTRPRVSVVTSVPGGSPARPRGNNMLVEKHSGLRVSSPLLSQAELDSAIRQRKVITMTRMAQAPGQLDSKGDWVTFGVVFFKHPPKTSSSGNDFSIWKMTDLKGDIATVSLFLFGKAHKEHWKMPLNKVIGILNPKLMDGKEGKKNDVTISIDHPDKLMEIGESVDLSTCDFVKPSGQRCTNVVNKALCNYCVYHLKSAYKNHASSRSSLQSSYSGGGGNEMTRQRLMSKVAGKGETIFGGGQILNTQAPVVLGKKSLKSKAKDNQLIASLGGVAASSGGSKMVNEVVTTGKFRGKPMGAFLTQEQKAVVAKVSDNISEELGARLLSATPGSRMFLSTMCKDKKEEEAKKNPVVHKSAKDLLLEHKRNLQFNSPKLGRGLSKTGEFSLDISPSVKKNYLNASQSKALAILKMKGNNLAKVDPNNQHRSKNRTPDVKDKIKKRIRSEEDEIADEENMPSSANKKRKTETKTVMVFGKEVKIDDLEAARDKSSQNTHLIDEAELEAVDNYFFKAEAKDAIEQKMLDTKSVKVKAVSCSICNYTDFKSSELCKQQGHKVKVIDATKRFFSCKDCKRRTVSLDRLPKKTCDKCGGSSWERAGMIAERKGPQLDTEKLSVRGNEETFLGSTSGAVNINI